ncbi:hypothetical protein D9Q98_004835 [Chlorella vulgaris]|uniref:Uncharacterized protein n=1 Tax=Chlorella vulgaris TaxID=3077 RepID=A0A9D4TND8_CHLVU|nr:hypothetical protein D9Q98_004835 [Chlorella vulgaris]
MGYLDDLMLLPNGSASLRDPCWHGDLSMMYERDVDGLLDMYERDEYPLDDPPVELPAPCNSVALSAFLCLDPQHATQAGALHSSTPHTPAVTMPLRPSTATAQIPFTSINVAPAASCYTEPETAHFITASAVSPPAAPSTTMDCTASKVGPGVGTPCKLADHELALALTKIAKNLGEGVGDEDALCRGSNTVIAAALTQGAGISISYSIVSRRFPQKEAASWGQTK